MTVAASLPTAWWAFWWGLTLATFLAIFWLWFFLAARRDRDEQ